MRAQIKLNGKTTRTVRGAALGLPIDLRGLPKGRFCVEIVTTDRAGKRLVGKRRYRTCVPRRTATLTLSRHRRPRSQRLATLPLSQGD